MNYTLGFVAVGHHVHRGSPKIAAVLALVGRIKGLF